MNEPFKKRRGRIGALMVVLAGLFVLIALRLAALVIFDGPRLTSLARTEHMGEVALAAPRVTPTPAVVRRDRRCSSPRR